MRPQDGPGHAARRVTPSGRLIPADLDEDMVQRVVHRFYERVRSDTLLWPVFEAAIPEAAWARHLATMQDFWSSMLLGSGRYRGQPLPRHLGLPGIDTQHFERWLDLFSDVAVETCPPQVAALFIDRAERVAQSFRLALAFHRGEDSTAIIPLRAHRRSPTEE